MRDGAPQHGTRIVIAAAYLRRPALPVSPLPAVDVRLGVTRAVGSHETAQDTRSAIAASVRTVGPGRSGGNVCRVMAHAVPEWRVRRAPPSADQTSLSESVPRAEGSAPIQEAISIALTQERPGLVFEDHGQVTGVVEDVTGAGSELGTPARAHHPRQRLLEIRHRG